MKIAILTGGFLPVLDGVTVGWFYRLQKLSQFGYEVLFLCPDYRGLAHLYPNWKDYVGNILPGVRVVGVESIPFIGVDFERNIGRRSYPQILTELQQFQPDILHVEEPERLFIGSLKLFPGLDYGRAAKIPCVACFRTNFSEYLEDFFSVPPGVISGLQFLLRKLLVLIYNRYDLTLVPSVVTQQKLIEFGIKNTQYEDLNGFDFDRFDLSLQADQFFAKTYQISGIDDKVKLVFVGRLTPDKGWNFTLSALPQALVKLGIENIALIIVGDGQLQGEIAEKLSQVTPHVHFLGRVAPENIPAVLFNSDIYITASEKENRSVTLIEALGAGLPAIAPRAGGVVQDIQDGWNGFLFEPQNAEQFEEALRRLVEDVTLRQSMGARSRDYAAQYSWDQTVRNLVRRWQQQLEQNEKGT
ncbi:MAG: glycosyltransferase [Microcoleaceae cyanobacterium]